MAVGHNNSILLFMIVMLVFLVVESYFDGTVEIQKLDLKDRKHNYLVVALLQSHCKRSETILVDQRLSVFQHCQCHSVVSVPTLSVSQHYHCHNIVSFIKFLVSQHC